MKDKDKTKEQLPGELQVLRTRLARLERGTPGEQPPGDDEPVCTCHASKPDIPNEMLTK